MTYTVHVVTMFHCSISYALACIEKFLTFETGDWMSPLSTTTNKCIISVVTLIPWGYSRKY